MVEYLQKLMDDEEWTKALEYAEELLRNRGLTAVELAMINAALCNLRYKTTDYAGSVLAGFVASAETERLGLWDAYGKTCLDLCAAYHKLGQFIDAESAVYRYLENLHSYSLGVAQFEATAWFNAGTLHTTMARHEEAARDYANGLAAATRLGLHRYAHGIRQALIEVYLRLGSLDRIPRLLARCGHYLRQPNSIDPRQKSLFSHYQLRIDYALATRRAKRARTVALRALSAADGEPRHQYTFHMQLARMARQSGCSVEALGHSTAARICAVNCRRFDLEAEATAFMYDTASNDPQSVELLDGYYLT